MRTSVRSGAVLTGLAVALAAACLQCTLDFDRYDPSSGAADARQDQSSIPPDAGVPPRPDAGRGLDADLDAQNPCPTPQACLTKASSCAMACRTAYQNCTSGCHGGPGNGGCMMGCTSTEQSCGGQCTTTCIACGNDASCTSSTLQSDCLQSGSP
jgi:hypothetical protein